jgi:glycosyltransferase involved in cell wall biosynthesis
MAAGIPPVADDVGVSAATIGGAGYAVSGAEPWLEALQAVAGDAGLRAHLGEAGRRRVEEEFSPRRWLPTIATILRGG